MHLHLNPVRPTFLLHEKQRLGCFCTGGLGLGGCSGGVEAAAADRLEAVSTVVIEGLVDGTGDIATGAATGEDGVITIEVGSATMGVGAGSACAPGMGNT